MIDPTLVPRDALEGIDVAISVSDSADLIRLGLDARHANLAIGEIARAVLLAGGRITYGGRVRPSGFTQQLMNEVRRYGAARRSLSICLALPEHRVLSHEEIDVVDRQLGTWGRLITLDGAGVPMSWRDDDDAAATTLEHAEQAAAYSGLRAYLARETNARVLVGGQLRDYKGTMPGVIEEAILAIEHGQPLYLAGGFGGAACAVARTLQPEGFGWLPMGLPLGATDPGVRAALDQLARASENGWSVTRDGLTGEERALLAASHRPGEIASLIVLGLARTFMRGPSRKE